MGPSLKDCIGPIYNTNRQYHTTLLNENTGIGLWNLEDWGQSLTLIYISMSGNFLITSRIKCSTPLHLKTTK
jgi:hypothetical protein